MCDGVDCSGDPGSGCYVDCTAGALRAVYSGFGVEESS